MAADLGVAVLELPQGGAAKKMRRPYVAVGLAPEYLKDETKGSSGSP